MKNVAIRLFLCLALVQIAVPVSIILQREAVLRSGAQYRFRTTPVDPFDAFRGRFVALGFEEALIDRPKGRKSFQRNQRVYAHLKNDSEGFAKVVDVTQERPEHDNYMQVTVGSMTDPKKLRLNFPMNRYYMEETAAPRAERAYQRHSQKGVRDAYVTVRIKSGKVVVEELYIGGKPVKDFIRER